MARSASTYRTIVVVGITVGTILLSLLSPPGVAGQTTPDFEPPTVSAELILDRASFERSDDSVTGTLVVTNPSNLTIEATMRGTSRDFTTTLVPEIQNTPGSGETGSPLSFQLPPYSATEKKITVDPTGDAAFGDQKVSVLVSYTWAAQGEAPAGSGATSATEDVKLLHHFEEATGIVDGGAAALYFLLPLLILFTAFVISRSFALEGQFPPQLPELDLKSFPLLILAAALVYAAADRADFQIYTGDLPSDSMLLKIVVYMTLAGTAIPLVWWGIRTGKRAIWGFRGDEKEAEIIRKAITGPMKRVDFEAVTAKVNGMEYKGILLEERERCFFLGPELEVTPKPNALSPEEDAKFESDVVSESGEIIDRSRLAELVAEDKLNFGDWSRVTRSGVASAKLVCRVDAKLDAPDRHPSALVKASKRN